MPSPSEILAGATRIANEALAWAIVWHVAVGTLLTLAVRGWRPSRRTIALLISAPLASASTFAWIEHNPFNGSVLAAVALILVSGVARIPRAALDPGRRWEHAFGALLIAFAWLYPHFLPERSPLVYLYAAPMGVIPCPSLSLAIGASLLTHHPGGRRQTYALACAGGLYGLLGVFYLGVWIDVLLLAGAVALVVPVLRRGSRDPFFARRGEP
jgi:hypothetical protein